MKYACSIFFLKDTKYSSHLHKICGYPSQHDKLTAFFFLHNFLKKILSAHNYVLFIEKVKQASVIPTRAF